MRYEPAIAFVSRAILWAALKSSDFVIVLHLFVLGFNRRRGLSPSDRCLIDDLCTQVKRKVKKIRKA